jgi:uncharacterized protein
MRLRSDASLVLLDEVAPQPWRNGGGVTRELLAWPSAADWQLRLSVADIERDGPFSGFPGVQRWFCVLEGDGVSLSVDGVVHRLQPGSAPLSFSGEAHTHATLTGNATRDLNLMLRGRQGGLLPVVSGQPWLPPGAPWGLFTMDGGQLSLASGRAACATATPPTFLEPIAGAEGGTSAAAVALSALSAPSAAAANAAHAACSTSSASTSPPAPDTPLPPGALLVCGAVSLSALQFIPAHAGATAWWWWSAAPECNACTTTPPTPDRSPP